jgi:hypothetical protein
VLKIGIKNGKSYLQYKNTNEGINVNIVNNNEDLEKI